MRLRKHCAAPKCDAQDEDVCQEAPQILQAGIYMPASSDHRRSSEPLPANARNMHAKKREEPAYLAPVITSLPRAGFKPCALDAGQCLTAVQARSSAQAMRHMPSHTAQSKAPRGHRLAWRRSQHSVICVGLVTNDVPYP